MLNSKFGGQILKDQNHINIACFGNLVNSSIKTIINLASLHQSMLNLI